MLFIFAGAAYAYAEEPKNTAASAGFSTIDPLKSVLDKNDFELTADKITENSAVLNWKTDKNYIGYTVYKYNILTNKWEEYAQTTKESIEVKDLSAGTVHRFCVLNRVTNELLGAVQVKTPLNTPKLSIKEKTSNKIVLSLGKRSKNETVVIYRKASNNKFKMLAEVKGKSTYTDKKLKSNKTYSYKAYLKVKNGSKVSVSDYSPVLKTKTLLSMGLPSVSGKTKTFAYYTAVTAKGSPQYKLLRSNKCTTDKETGIRMYDGCYCVALGSYYGTKIGTKYRITFSSGKSINVILCDQKANRHTDSKHQYAVNNKDIVEFYVQKGKMPRAIRGRGDYGVLSQFKGSIVSIEKYMD